MKKKVNDPHGQLVYISCTYTRYYDVCPALAPQTPLN